MRHSLILWGNAFPRKASFPGGTLLLSRDAQSRAPMSVSVPLLNRRYQGCKKNACHHGTQNTGQRTSLLGCSTSGEGGNSQITCSLEMGCEGRE